MNATWDGLYASCRRSFEQKTKKKKTKNNSVLNFNNTSNTVLFLSSWQLFRSRLYSKRLKHTLYWASLYRKITVFPVCLLCSSTRLPHGFWEETGRKPLHTGENYRRNFLPVNSPSDIKLKFYTYQHHWRVKSLQAESPATLRWFEAFSALWKSWGWYSTSRELLMFSAALCLWPAVFEPANQSAPSRWGRGHGLTWVSFYWEMKTDAKKQNTGVQLKPWKHPKANNKVLFLFFFFYIIF